MPLLSATVRALRLLDGMTDMLVIRLMLEKVGCTHSHLHLSYVTCAFQHHLCIESDFQKTRLARCLLSIPEITLISLFTIVCPGRLSLSLCLALSDCHTPGAGRTVRPR